MQNFRAIGQLFMENIVAFQIIGGYINCCECVFIRGDYTSV